MLVEHCVLCRYCWFQNIKSMFHRPGCVCGVDGKTWGVVHAVLRDLNVHELMLRCLMFIKTSVMCLLNTNDNNEKSIYYFQQ